MCSALKSSIRTDTLAVSLLGVDVYFESTNNGNKSKASYRCFFIMLFATGGQGVLPCERPMLIGVVSYAYQDAEVVL